ncbi:MULTISPECIES: nitrogen fixation protein NifX [Bradyrhizobium]|uniref:Nitrogen fixation protein NifX n=3 Tax=Bradyrhizobium TaxID=374 RepID=A0AAE5X8X3_9BRAD|nr:MULTISPECIES: nitrogen fixation protein NifX [Bradyrhizobium]MCG2632636.1 nitrogen fixation protein NifX [Bradyrhizobium zhengyangense]MCG2645397.1 nitrogen fixation protein NifX [Bradyrhizobium zhengyangense]MCG2672869.1 nitrogen fixation protein NifX [Bradyrhizobium zhengyangense]MDN4985679.1 nitrogen fixation protein NifX [Bradyrhizobium sp. WYCCWR 13022]MDT4740880.1 nitrogen fixation protein NifX [Bradyrhizobium sp. WYCCWR 12699]
MKVAFATQDLKCVDAHFGWAKNIAIYDVTPDAHRILQVIEFGDDLTEDGRKDKLTRKIDAIKDCTILYVAAIGGSAAARVVANKIHPLTVIKREAIETLCIKLEDALKGSPPPWLRKALGGTSKAPLHFDDCRTLP